ncbi:cupin domain-containing protein [Pseudomonas fluorescens]|uniref:Cupin domain-containing protein n=1 Tax=Pseudomonas fluorescens TaxID=294 RepID=A0A944HAB0_PSEFL|nr:cupin domain-containing protein [Pseudomonas fluorescens]MBT2295795.1 cupin domain-containing protein [Pseudomonas fluorescens]MBT2306052.1 cupin domain-containing protein [Pseudomonas fluorescens]MBT2314591.1 cupin domain-containing protein [Pseudomonas fluorescens]MBT2315660.1 cupin domain-containing protein [Pseudomonas fluorescens]MBT2327100.1 cupin domain-containing protein [Pseudomonas fluorescens]
MKILCLIATLSLLPVAPVYAHETAPAEKVNVLQEKMLKNLPANKAMMLTVDYAPGQSSTAHKHEGTAMAYVLEGAITSQVKGEPATTYKAGEFWYEAAGSEHLVSKNASSTEPAKLLVFMVMGEHEAVLIPLKN